MPLLCALGLFVLSGCNVQEGAKNGKNDKTPVPDGEEVCPGNACGAGCDPCGPWAICVEGECQDVDCQPGCAAGNGGPNGCGGTCEDGWYDEEYHSDSPSYAMDARVMVSDYSGYYPEVVPCKDVYFEPWDMSSDSGGAGWDGASCTPYCSGKECGSDGCGGSCGSCPQEEVCGPYGQCDEAPEGCIPDCVGKEPGDSDDCGGLCTGGGTSIGLVPGGAQDAAYFRLLVAKGEVPEPGVLPIEGFLTEHGTPLPDPDLEKSLTLHGFLGINYQKALGKELVVLQLGMNSGLSPEQIEAGQFNLAVVIDKSGSMSGGSINAVKTGLKLMVDVLDANDTLSIVVYDSYGSVLLPAGPVTDKQKIKEIIDSIKAEGSTNLYEGMVLGYGQIIENIAEDKINRIMLLSDGMTNAGVTNLDQILAKSKEYNDQGIGITTIGVGTGFNFDLMHLLATQGSGNFYFIDTAEKLVEVFQEDIKYLLTPVAYDLNVSFTLTDGFKVVDVYGFDYKVQDGLVTLLAPKPEYSIEADKPKPPDPPDDPPEPVDPQNTADGTEIAAPTLFASKKNGMLMVKLEGPEPEVAKSLSDLTFAEVNYSYVLAGSGEKESWVKQIDLGEMTEDEEGYLQFFSNNIVSRNLCLLRLALSMKEACRLVHEEAAVQPALAELDYAEGVCKRINLTVMDESILEDLSLLSKLRKNVLNSP